MERKFKHAIEKKDENLLANVPRMPNSETDLNSLREFAQEKRLQDEEIASVEECLKDLKAKRTRLVRETIPDAFLSAGMESIKLLDGGEMGIKYHVKGSVCTDPKKENYNWDEVVAYLEEMGESAIISGNMTFKFKRGQRELVDALLELINGSTIDFILPDVLLGNFYAEVNDGDEASCDVSEQVIEVIKRLSVLKQKATAYDISEKIHHKTLDSFVKDHVDDPEFPRELFQVHDFHEAFIKEKK